ncbi:hypothetical protein [Clostridium sporogenes]|uniref:hypothetical protein n=1 Tax=Clostridium sporogenes TaxID=1509 RepID=UPI0005EDF2DA|nr:hypothetical protein [Clostridium sporogenes]
MNYNAFISKYPWFDLILEIFKGIMPTIMALLAIYINNKRAREREKKKIAMDINLRTLENLQNHTIDLYNMVYNTGTEFLGYIQNLDIEEREDINFNRFYESTTSMLLFCRKIKCLAEVESVKTGIEEISFDKCFEEVSKYSSEAIPNIIERYNNKAIKTPKSNLNQLLDDVQQQLIIASGNVEKEILYYTETLAKAYNRYILSKI